MLAVTCVSAMSCGDGGPATTMPTPVATTETNDTTTAPEGPKHLFSDPATINPDAYYTAIIDSGYKNFARAPGYETPQASFGPHSETIVIYINDILSNAITGQTGLDAWPDGSLIVKEGYDADGNLDFLPTMEKYNDQWYYAEYDDSGNLFAAGLESGSCTRCHTDTNDAVLAFDLP